MSEANNNTGSTRKGLSFFNKHEWISKNITYFLFVGILAVIYIANGHWADKTIRKTRQAESEVKELEYEYKSLQKTLIFKTREEEVVEKAKTSGLKTPAEPPFLISNEEEKK